jgi:hypothetical protein
VNFEGFVVVLPLEVVFCTGGNDRVAPSISALFLLVDFLPFSLDMLGSIDELGTVDEIIAAG